MVFDISSRSTGCHVCDFLLLSLGNLKKRKVFIPCFKCGNKIYYPTRNRNTNSDIINKSEDVAKEEKAEIQPPEVDNSKEINEKAKVTHVKIAVASVNQNENIESITDEKSNATNGIKKLSFEFYSTNFQHAFIS